MNRYTLTLTMELEEELQEGQMTTAKAFLGSFARDEGLPAGRVVDVTFVREASPMPGVADSVDRKFDEVEAEYRAAPSSGTAIPSTDVEVGRWFAMVRADLVREIRAWLISEPENYIAEPRKLQPHMQGVASRMAAQFTSQTTEKK